MAQCIVIFWRDIPAQVVVKAGRASAKRELSKRFIEAIDRVAMREELAGSESYLDQWRRGEPVPCGDDLAAAADAAAATLEAEYSDVVLNSSSPKQGFGTGLPSRRVAGASPACGRKGRPARG